MMDKSPRCYIPSLVEIGPLVPEKKLFKVVTIDWHGGHLGHVTMTIYTYLGSLVLRMLHIKFGFD